MWFIKNTGHSAANHARHAAERIPKMAKYEKSFTTAIHAQTSYRHGVNC
jgi:hypothetical protein